MASAAQLQVLVGADIQGALRGLNQVNRAVTGVGGFFTHAASTAVGFTAAMLGINAAGGALDAFRGAAFGLNGALEQNDIAFTTLLGSAGAAQAFLSDLAAFAARTPFEFQGLARSSQQFLAVGFQAEQIIPLLTDVGNAAAAMGSGTQGVQSITRALLQMKGIGVVQMGELNQLSEQGINGLQLLAAATGKSTTEIRKAIEKGEIGADTFIEAFQNMSRLRFGGMMEKQALTLEGAMSTIKDSLGMGAARAFSPLFELVREGAVNLSALVQTKSFDAFITRTRAGVQSLVQPFGTFAVMVGNIAKAHGLNVFQAALVATELLLAQTFGPQVAGVFNRFIQFLRDDIPAAAATLANLWSTQVQPKMEAFWGWIQETALPRLGDLKTWLETHLPPAIENLAVIWESRLQPAIQAVLGLATGLAGAFGKIADPVAAAILADLDDALLGIAAAVAVLSIPTLVAAAASFTAMAVAAGPLWLLAGAVGLLAVRLSQNGPAIAAMFGDFITSVKDALRWVWILIEALSLIVTPGKLAVAIGTGKLGPMLNNWMAGISQAELARAQSGAGGLDFGASLPPLPLTVAQSVTVQMGGVTVSNEADEARLADLVAEKVAATIAAMEERALQEYGAAALPGAE